MSLTSSREKPWLMRTYSGHSSPEKSNELYRTNLAKGQTGLSIAFDLPTQLALDPDDALSLGEVGKVGVPVPHLTAMSRLFSDIPLEKMNTSMTINAPAIWLFALYHETARSQGADVSKLMGTTQNDIIKEYLSRGTYIFPPAASLRLSLDLIEYTSKNVPAWNPINICSYHLQEAGATPAQEVAFSLANATVILDGLAQRLTRTDFEKAVGRISFFVNSGMRFVEEIGKMRVFSRMWDQLLQKRFQITDPKARLFRYGVQVNSLGLTEQQPENNIIRIVYEILGVTLSKNARARAVQLPAWNEALGLPRPWDQQLSLRIQQILAYETDLLEYGDLFAGSHAMQALEQKLEQEANELLQQVENVGGAVNALEWMKTALVRSQNVRLQAIQDNQQIVVGINAFQETTPSPLVTNDIEAICVVDPREQQVVVEQLKKYRVARKNGAEIEALLDELRSAAQQADVNLVPISLKLAAAGATTGEWGSVLRQVFGTYQGPTGIKQAPRSENLGGQSLQVLEQVKKLATQLGRQPKILVGKPGLDGHSNGAEQIALAARNFGFDVVYLGIRLTPQEIVNVAVQEDVDLVGLSILSGSHLALIQEVMNGLKHQQANIPVVCGGIFPPADHEQLKKLGVAKIFTPKDYLMAQVILEMTAVIEATSA